MYLGCARCYLSLNIFFACDIHTWAILFLLWTLFTLFILADPVKNFLNITYSVVFNLSVSKVSAEPLGKSKNTRVGSLSLLQQIFPTQESNRGLLHRRRILYQLSYEGSPCSTLRTLFLGYSKKQLKGK